MRYKKKLLPPIAQLRNLKVIAWNPDVLPEMLLVDAAVQQLSWKGAPGALHKVLDLLDSFVEKDTEEVITGTVSSMRLIPSEKRGEAVKALLESGLYEIILPEDLRHGLALYPDSPVEWMIAEWRKKNRIEWEVGVSYLKNAVRRLWDSKSVHSTRCRMIPIARLMKHGKLKLSADLDIVKLLPNYPEYLTEEEQKEVESFTRAMFNAVFGEFFTQQTATNWSVYFWRHNFEISPCEYDEQLIGQDIVEKNEVIQVLSGVERALQEFHSIVQKAIRQAKLDIYDLDRDEVIFGLLSRQYRLFSVVARNPSLWTIDLGRLFHRIMADIFITLKWLVSQNNRELFRRFKEFSLGKQKLLKLHIQDLVDKGREDLSEYAEYLSEIINEEIWEEFLSIDLGGNFSGKNIRAMAHESGLRDLYNLVYAPLSSDLHSEWVSLKKYNLARCRNPLHRFHRVPRLTPLNIISPYSVVFAGQLLSDTFKVCLDVYNLPGMEKERVSFVVALENAFQTIYKKASNSSLNERG